MRTIVTSEHSRDDLDTCLDAFERVGRELAADLKYPSQPAPAMLPFGSINRARAAAHMTDRRLSAAIHRTIADPIVRPSATASPAPADAPLDDLAARQARGTSRRSAACTTRSSGRSIDTSRFGFGVARTPRTSPISSSSASSPRCRAIGTTVTVLGMGLPDRAECGDRPPAADRRTEPLDPIPERDDTGGPDAISLHEEEIRELRAAILRLTPDQREALILRYASGLSADEAAQVMGRRAGTIRGLTFRAIEALRRQLGGAQDQ